MNKRYLIPLTCLVIMLASYINTEMNLTYEWEIWLGESLIMGFIWYCGYKANE